MGELTDEEIEELRRDQCPDCHQLGLRPGPHGGAGQNLFCDDCGSGFNVSLPRYVLMAQRIDRR